MSPAHGRAPGRRHLVEAGPARQGSQEDWTTGLGTSLGHPGSWNDPAYQELLVRGFNWALKKDTGSTR